MSNDLTFVELTADVLEIFVWKYVKFVAEHIRSEV